MFYCNVNAFYIVLKKIPFVFYVCLVDIIIKLKVFINKSVPGFLAILLGSKKAVC